MKQSTLICFILFLSFSSCTKVILFVMGAEQPKYKTDQDVREYAQKTFNHDGDILRLKGFNDNSKMPFGIKNMPTVMYVEKGSMSKYVTTCSADYSDIIESYNSDFKDVKVDSTFFADDITNNLYSISGEDISVEEPTFYVFYARFVGRLNKRDVLPWMDEIKSKTGAAVRLVNCDISEELE